MLNSHQIYFFLLVFSIFVTGCATSYKPLNEGLRTGGYSDRKIGDNQFWIRVDGNSFTSKSLLEEYWHRRANELCELQKYTSNYSFGTQQRTTYVYRSTGLVDPGTHEYAYIEGQLDCAKSTNDTP